MLANWRKCVFRQFNCQPLAVFLDCSEIVQYQQRHRHEWLRQGSAKALKRVRRPIWWGIRYAGEISRKQQQYFEKVGGWYLGDIFGCKLVGDLRLVLRLRPVPSLVPSLLHIIVIVVPLVLRLSIVRIGFPILRVLVRRLGQDRTGRRSLLPLLGLRTDLQRRVPRILRAQHRRWS